MINLTTSCRKSDTLLAALFLTFFVTLPGYGQLKESSSPTQNPTDSEVSVLELNDDATGIEPRQNQQTNIPDSIVNLETVEPQVLLRGPLHEAFAEAHQADPQPNPIVKMAPPETINEVPPEFKPEGDNVQWIPGYWAWDDSQDDFIWISGVWRDVPPNQRWVAGYWEQVEDGFRWIAGFWAGLDQQELNYLPAPPASLDHGPSVAAPSDDYFYCPGNWEYQNNKYVWRTGHWQPRVADWIWVPARYIWTPRGCIYLPGYWDREFEVRGVLFAPVYFHRRQYLATNFSFRPSHCVNTGAEFFVHLFVRPNCNHYFYGDWYGQNFVNIGFRPWIQPQSHFRYYDPLFSHYNCSRYRHGSQLLISWINIQHRHYHRNRDLRPRNTLQAQLDFSKSIRDRRHYDFVKRANLANRYDDIVGRNGNRPNANSRNNLKQRNDNPNFNRNYVRTNTSDLDQHRINELVQREIRKTRKSGEQRSKTKAVKDSRVVQDSRKKQPKSKNNRSSHVDSKTKPTNGNGRESRSKQIADNRNRANPGQREIVQSNKLDLPRTPVIKPETRIDRRGSKGLTRGQVEKAERDQRKALRQRELEQKIAAAKHQAEIKRKQREAARELSQLQRRQSKEQSTPSVAQTTRSPQPVRKTNSSRTKKQIEESVIRSQASRDKAKSLQPQTGTHLSPNRKATPNEKRNNAPNAIKRTARQNTDLTKQRETQNRLAADRAKRLADQKTSSVREASRQRDLQRQREKVANAQTAAQKRKQTQARVAQEKSQRDKELRAAQQRARQKAQIDAQRRAREKSQRDAERRAAQQRARQKSQADAQRRAQEKSQRDAQRNAADRARRAADAARKRQREREQAARRAKRKKK